jgi:DNA-binding beta-propeller fold protein YncE
MNIAYRRCAGPVIPWLLALTISLLAAFPAFAATYEYLLVGNQAGNIVRYDAATGSFVDELVPRGRGDLSYVMGMAIGPDGYLYVGDGPRIMGGDAWVRKYDRHTGAYMGVFASGAALTLPIGITFGGDGNLYVSDDDNEVLRFDGRTGASMGVFSSILAPGNAFRGSAWGADGNLYVAQLWGGLLRFDGHTGTLLDRWPVAQTFSPHYIAFGPDGLLYLSDYFAGNIDVYNPTDGAFVRSLFGSALDGVAGLAFNEKGDLFAASLFSNSISKFAGPSSFGSVVAQGRPLNDPFALVISSELSPVVPEPGVHALMLAGLGVLAFAMRLRKGAGR